jgi:hypothetical protein
VIVGRSPNLIVGLLGGLFNVVVAFQVAGFSPSTEQIGVVNAFILALVAAIANTTNIQIAAGKAAAERKANGGTP